MLIDLTPEGELISLDPGRYPGALVVLVTDGRYENSNVKTSFGGDVLNPVLVTTDRRPRGEQLDRVYRAFTLKPGMTYNAVSYWSSQKREAHITVGLSNISLRLDRNDSSKSKDANCRLSVPCSLQEGHYPYVTWDGLGKP